MHDSACILEPGEYDFIKDPSFIDYKFAEVESEDDIDAKIKSGDATRKDPMVPELLERIRKGIATSRHTKRRVKEWYAQKRMDELA